MEKFCKDLPKIELHAHLNGSISAETLIKLGCVPASVDEYQMLRNTNRSLVECFALFKVAHEATKNTTALYTATTSVIQDFCDDNCLYLELRTTPRAEPGMTKEDYIETVVSAIRNFKGAICVKLILSIDRRHDFETSRDAIELIIRMRKKHPVIVGVDLCGDPSEGRFEREIFERARNCGLRITLHCGEVENNEEVMEMLNFRPDRIGHGTFVFPRDGLGKDRWRFYLKKPIPIECCMTSNVLCGTVDGYESHHIKGLIRHSLPFSISTDDKGVFNSKLSNEYYLAQKHYNLTKEELWYISHSALDYSFAMENEKEQLKIVLQVWKLENIL